MLLLLLLRLEGGLHSNLTSAGFLQRTKQVHSARPGFPLVPVPELITLLRSTLILPGTAKLRSPQGALRVPHTRADGTHAPEAHVELSPCQTPSDLHHVRHLKLARQGMVGHIWMLAGYLPSSQNSQNSSVRWTL